MREKSLLEKKLDTYYMKFDKNYPLMRTDMRSDEEIIKDINDCLETGKPKPDPVYEDDYIY